MAFDHVGGEVANGEGGQHEALKLFDKHISHKKKSAQFTRKLRNYWKHEIVEIENQSIEWVVSIVGASFKKKEMGD